MRSGRFDACPVILGAGGLWAGITPDGKLAVAKVTMILEVKERPASAIIAVYRSSYLHLDPSMPDRIYALIPERTLLCRAESRDTLIPINRAQLSGLERLKHPNDFINVATNVQIMHHLVA